MKPMLPTPMVPLAPTVLLGVGAGPGTDVEPILDGAPTAAFQSDLAACRTLVRKLRQFDRETAGFAATGAGLGGALAGASEVSERREAIVLERLRSWGHRVVG